MQKLKDITDAELLKLPQPNKTSRAYGRWMRLRIMELVTANPGISSKRVSIILSCKSPRGTSDSFKRYIRELVSDGLLVKKQEPFATCRDSILLYPADYEEPEKEEAEKPRCISREMATLRVFQVPPERVYDYIPKHPYARQGFSRHQPQSRRERVYAFDH